MHILCKKDRRDDELKRIIAIFSVLTMIILALPVHTYAIEDNIPFELKAKSAVLMDADSGEVLYSKNGDEPLPPASVTKIMTLLCVMEAIDGGSLTLEEKVSVSANAASMGGSQVFLEVGEEMTVDEMLKCVVVSSANDAAVALAERVAGSEEAFVHLMNQRAAELGMKNTNFENVTGLDDSVKNHTISAYDIAIASRELITKHPKIFDYTTIWMDTVRNGEFGLSNTNRLIRFYKGATGLKTGSTSKAGFCISATAKRDGLHLIAVIMGSETRDIRNGAATMLLDWGFATFSTYAVDGGKVEGVRVQGGEKDVVSLTYPSFTKLLGKGKEKKITVERDIPETLKAPVAEGDVVGSVKYMCDGVEIGRVDVCVAESVNKIGFLGILLDFFRGYFVI